MAVLAKNLIHAVEQGREAHLLKEWHGGIAPLRGRILEAGVQPYSPFVSPVEMPLLTKTIVLKAFFDQANALAASTISLDDGETDTTRFSTLDRVCHRISVVSTSNSSTVVQVSWRDSDGGYHHEPDKKAGEQTGCFGEVAILTLLAVGGDNRDPDGVRLPLSLTVLHTFTLPATEVMGFGVNDSPNDLFDNQADVLCTWLDGSLRRLKAARRQAAVSRQD